MIAEKHKRDTEYCTFCPKMCRFVCPTGIAEARETVTPTGKQTMLYLVQRESVPLDNESADVFYHCTGCGLCTQFCDHGIEVYPVMETARAESVNAGVVIPAAQKVLESFRQYSNAYGNILPAYTAMAGSRILRQAQVFYVPDASAVAENGRGLQAVLKVLDRLGADNVAMWPGPMLSSGYELLTLGFYDEFRRYASEFAAVAAGARTLIFAAAHDYETVAKRYPEFGITLDAELLTVTQWLRRELPGKTVPSHASRRVLYHDSCTEGRGLGDYDGPRDVIALINGLPPLEFPWNRDKSKCCGWGGGYVFTEPEGSTRVARLRVEEASERRYDEIVSSSPACAGQLKRASGDTAPVYDLVSWVAERLA